MRSGSIKRVQAHYEALAPHVEALAALFYARLFAEHPEVQSLFKTDPQRQSAHLAAALALVVRNLDRIEMLEGPLKQLGAMHVDFGARPEHYPIVCRLIVETIAEVSGESLTPELRADWTDAMSTIAAMMLRGASERVLNTAESLSPTITPKTRWFVKR